MSTPNRNSDSECSECLLGSMVTPGEYWLINKNPAHTLAIQKLEQELSAAMEKNSDIPQPDEVDSAGCIAVECPPGKGVWKRGRTVTKIGRAVFKVFLVDSGQVIQITIKRIRTQMDPKFLKVEPLAFKFCLYGIVPCSVQEGRKKVTLKWTDESRNFVTKILSKKHFFHIKIVHMLGRTLLGDIYLFNKRSGQFYSLSRLLCAKDLAIYAEQYYREKVMLLEHSLVDNRFLTPDSEVSVHMDTKLKRMEELRLVNMQPKLNGHFQKESGAGSSGSQSDDNDELEESALCDSSSQLARELLHNLNMSCNLRSQSVSDLPEAGSSMSSNFQTQKLDKEVVDGSHDELPPLESVKRKPRPKSQTEKQASRSLKRKEVSKPVEEMLSPRPVEEKPSPRPVEEKPSPRPVEEKPSPRPVEEKPSPRPVEEKPSPRPKGEKPSSRPKGEKPSPRPVEEKPSPRPVEEKPSSRPKGEKPSPRQKVEKPSPRPVEEKPSPRQKVEKPSSRPKGEKPSPRQKVEKPSPRPVEEKPSPRPLMEIDVSKPVVEKPGPRPLMQIDVLKPVVEKQSPRPLTILEFPKPMVGIEIPKPLEGVEFRQPSVGREIRKALERVQFRKPLVGMETPKLVTEKQIPEPFMEFETLMPEKQIPNSLMEMGIPEPAGKDEVSKACNENDDLNETDGQKKARKGFKIIFEEKNSLPNLEIVGYHEIFYVFFDNVLEPLDHFKNLNVSRILFRNIEKQVMFERPTPIQRWAIPSIVNGDDLVIIGEPRTGKTLSYILGVLEVLKLKMEVGQFHLGKGPLAVILSSSSKTCEFIFRVFTLLITKKDRRVKVPLCKLNVRYVNNSVVERPSMPFMVNRSDVLISTPQCLLQILNNRSVLPLTKLNVVVFDGADVCAGEPFLTEMKILLNQSKMPKSVQKVFCGERWTQDFEALTRTFIKDHSAVIGSFLEAAAYINLKPHVFFIDVSEKDRTLLDIIRKEPKGHRIMIVCNNIEEVFRVDKLLKKENKICLVAHSESNKEELQSIKYNWGRSKESCIVVCTQDIIEALGIHNADVLINYSLPSDREVSFRGRFSVIHNRMKDNIFKSKGRPSVKFLIDDKTYFRLPELMDYFQRLGVEIPPSLKDKVDAEVEMSERELPLCENVLKFGSCKEVWKCNKRHSFIKELDFPEKPFCGIIKFYILKVHSTCHLSARIVEFSDQQNKYKKISFPDITLQVTRQLRSIFRDKNKRILLNPVKVNALCVLNRNDASGMRFHRARVMEIKTYAQPHKPDEVIVKLIDWGCLLQANAGKLLQLPEEVKGYPPLASDIYICNLMPKDFDREWSDRDVSFAESMFATELEENQVWIGRIKLSLKSSTFLVDPVKLCHTLDTENSYVIEFSASQKLVYSGIADERPEHLKTVYALCEKANIDTSIYEYNLDGSDFICQPECAHFDDDFMKIQFIYAESPTSLYVRISKFEDLLISLEAECNADGIRQKNSQNCNLSNPVLRKKLSIGMYCLALNGTSWNRAKIMSFEKDRAKVFFIDYGDTEYVEHVVPISEKLLMKLPSQAIECYLVGVNSEMNISDKVLGEIYDFSKNGSEELSVSVVEKAVKSQVTGGWKYGINLLSAEGKSLNKKLIDMGLVQPTRNHLDLAVDVENKLQIDDEIESDADTWDEDFEEDTNKDKADLSQIENLSIVDSAYGNDLNKDLVTPEANDELSYFLSMESGVFDDDSACCLLEEFLCNLAPEQVNRKEPQNEAKIDKKEDEPVPENNQVIVQEKERVDDVIPQEVPEAKEPKEEAPKEEALQGEASKEEASQEKAPQEASAREIVQNDSQLEAAALEARLKYLSKRSKPVKRTLPYLKHFPDNSVADFSKDLVPTEVFTPEILWSQTHTDIEVKIMLTNVKTYKFDCSVENFIFRCLLDNKPYVSHVRLFGAVNPEMTRVEIKTFFVQIVFQKLCPLVWPRLCRENKKFRWVKYNIEHFKEKKSTISEILCSQAMERMKSGNVIVPRVTNEIKFVPSSSSESSGDWSESDIEEV